MASIFELGEPPSLAARLFYLDKWTYASSYCYRNIKLTANSYNTIMSWCNPTD
jgi:hypothetical protein